MCPASPSPACRIGGVALPVTIFNAFWGGLGRSKDFACADFGIFCLRRICKDLLKTKISPKRNVGTTDGSNHDGTILMETQDMCPSGVQPGDSMEPGKPKPAALLLLGYKSQELRS